MNKNLRTYTFVLSTLALMSCSKTPTACFTVDKGSGSTHVNEEIQYNALCSTEADSYAWNYGDGSSDSGPQVKHKYRTAGSYTVQLTAKNSSKEASSTQTVVIVP